MFYISILVAVICHSFEREELMFVYVYTNGMYKYFLFFIFLYIAHLHEHFRDMQSDPTSVYFYFLFILCSTLSIYLRIFFILFSYFVSLKHFLPLAATFSIVCTLFDPSLPCQIEFLLQGTNKGTSYLNSSYLYLTIPIRSTLMLRL